MTYFNSNHFHREAIPWLPIPIHSVSFSCFGFLYSFNTARPCFMYFYFLSISSRILASWGNDFIGFVHYCMFNIWKALEIQLAFIELVLEFFIAFDCLIFPELLNICFVRSDFFPICSLSLWWSGIVKVLIIFMATRKVNIHLTFSLLPFFWWVFLYRSWLICHCDYYYHSSLK